MPLEGTTIYASVKCQLVPDESHTVQLRIVDGQGRTISNQTVEMKVPEMATINLYYVMNPATNAPGLWKFQYTIDGEHIEHYLLVMPFASAATPSPNDRVRVVSLSPSDDQPLQAGTTVHFSMKVSYTLDADTGSLGVMLQRGDRINRPDENTTASASKLISRGNGQASFDFEFVVPSANSLVTFIPLIAENEQRPRVAELKVFKIRSKGAIPVSRVKVEQIPGSPEAWNTRTRLGSDFKNGALIGEANAFDVTTRMVTGLTSVEGLSGPTEVVHHWYFSGRLINAFRKKVTPSNSAVFSRKNLGDMVGPWTLMVTGPGNTVLESRDFIITDKRLKMPTEKERKPTNQILRVVFSTGITEKDGPINEVHEIPLGPTQIFMFVGGEFSSEAQRFNTTIFDGKGNQAVQYTQQVCLCDKTKDPYIHLGYVMEPEVDAPGLWHFVMTLGTQQIDDYLWVAPNKEAKKVSNDEVKIRTIWPRGDIPIVPGETVVIAARVDYTSVNKRGMVIFDTSTGDLTTPPDRFSLATEVEPVTRGKGVVSFRTEVKVPEVDSLVVTVKLRPADATLRFATDLHVFKVKNAKSVASEDGLGSATSAVVPTPAVTGKLLVNKRPVSEVTKAIPRITLSRMHSGKTETNVAYANGRYDIPLTPGSTALASQPMGTRKILLITPEIISPGAPSRSRPIPSRSTTFTCRKSFISLTRTTITRKLNSVLGNRSPGIARR